MHGSQYLEFYSARPASFWEIGIPWKSVRTIYGQHLFDVFESSKNRLKVSKLTPGTDFGLPNRFPETCWTFLVDVFRSTKKRRKMLPKSKTSKNVQIRAFSSVFERFRTFSVVFGRFRAFSGVFERFRAFSSTFERFLTFSNVFGRFRVFSEDYNLRKSIIFLW